MGESQDDEQFDNAIRTVVPIIYALFLIAPIFIILYQYPPTRRDILGLFRGGWGIFDKQHSLAEWAVIVLGILAIVDEVSMQLAGLTGSEDDAQNADRMPVVVAVGWHSESHVGALQLDVVLQRIERVVAARALVRLD